MQCKNKQCRAIEAATVDRSEHKQGQVGDHDQGRVGPEKPRSFLRRRRPVHVLQEPYANEPAYAERDANRDRYPFEFQDLPEKNIQDENQEGRAERNEERPGRLGLAFERLDGGRKRRLLDACRELVCLA